MINLEANSLISRWFSWSCDHLPFTTAHYQEVVDDKRIYKCRSGAHYLSNGTTLCHVFWAILWVPLLVIAVACFFLFIIGAVHVLGHNDFVRQHPDSGVLLDAAAYFLPEAAVLGGAIISGLVFLVVFGGAKAGFFSLLWRYLKGIKQKVCPLVGFR